MGVPDFCVVRGCPNPQAGQPVCEKHWQLFFAGVCAVDGCDGRPPWDKFACPRHAGHWQRRKDERPPVSAVVTAAEKRTSREERIMALRARGMTYNEIAATVGVTNSTVAKTIQKLKHLLPRSGAATGHGALTGDLAALIDGAGVCEVCGDPVPVHRKASRWCSRACQDEAWAAEQESEPLRRPRRSRAERGCSVEGCDRPHQARGWCRMHYRRWSNHSDTDPLILRSLDVREVTAVCEVPDCWGLQVDRGRCRAHLNADWSS